MKFPLTGLVAAVAVTASCTAFAQAASAPAQVAVSASDAARAEKKAVPASDVGTVVRTGPTATDKAKAATHDGYAKGTGPTSAVPPAAGASRTANPKVD